MARGRKCINKFENFSLPGPEDEGTINIMKAGSWERRRMIWYLARCVEEFFEDPENEKKFEEWKKQRAAGVQG